MAKLIQEKKADMTAVISHRSTKLEDGPDLYKLFKDKEDGCTRVVFHPADLNPGGAAGRCRCPA